MRWLLAALLLLSPLQAEELAGRLPGPPPESRPVTLVLKGKLLQLQGQIFLADGAALRFRLKLRNTSRSRARYGLHVAVFDSGGQLLGATGSQDVVGIQPGQEGLVQYDLGMPKSALKRAASYRLTLYQDTAEMGRR